MGESTRIRGWAAIARALGVSEKTARKYARRGAFKNHKDLLPAFVDYRGPWVDPDALEQWKARTTMAWAASEAASAA